MLKIVLILMVVGVAVVVVIAVFKAKAVGIGEISTGTAGDDYQLKPAVLSPAERSFIGVVEPVLPSDVGYFAKIRLGDVFTTRKGLDASRRTRARNRINQKHVDFLIVRRSDLKPLGAIELDDSSHEAEERKTRDAFVDSVFQAAGLPILHLPARAMNNPAELKSQLQHLVAPANTLEPTKET